MLAGSQRDRGGSPVAPVKVTVVGPNKSGIWRRERIRMTDQELDDVAFLTGMQIRFIRGEFPLIFKIYKKKLKTTFRKNFLRFELNAITEALYQNQKRSLVKQVT